MHVAVVSGDHLQVEGGSRVAVEVSDEALPNLVAPITEVGGLHDVVRLKELVHDHLNPGGILVAGDNSTLGVVLVVDKLEAKLGKLDIGLFPDTSGDGISPKEKAIGLEDAPDLGKNLLLKVTDLNVGDVSLGNDDEVNRAISDGRLVSSVADTVGNDPAGKSWVVLSGVNGITGVDSGLLHVQRKVVRSGVDLTGDEVGTSCEERRERVKREQEQWLLVGAPLQCPPPPTRTAPRFSLLRPVSPAVPQPISTISKGLSPSFFLYSKAAGWVTRPA